MNQEYDCSGYCSRLVWSSGLLTSLQLLQVEITGLVVTVGVFKTSGEVSGVGFTLAAAHLLLLLSNLLDFLRSVGPGEKRGQTGTHGVTDGGTDSNTGGGGGHLSEQTWLLWLGGNWVCWGSSGSWSGVSGGWGSSHGGSLSGLGGVATKSGSAAWSGWSWSSS